MKINSIRLKVSLAIGLIILFFGAVTILATYQYTVNRLTNDKNSEIKLTLSLISQNLEEVISSSSRLANSFSSNPIIVELLQSPTPSTDKLQAANSLLPSFNLGNLYSAIYILNSQGVALISTDKTFVGQNYSFRPYFKQSIKGFSHIDASLGVTSKKIGYYFSSPIKDSVGQIIGVAVLKMDPDYLQKILDKNSISHLTDLIVADQYGTVISAVRKDRLLSSLGHPSQTVLSEIAKNQSYLNLDLKPLQYEPVQKIIENKTTGQQLIEFWDESDQETESLFVSSIPQTPFWLVAEVGNEDIEAQANQVALIISLTVFLAVVATLLGVFLMLSRMLSPISKIADMANNISLGKYDQNYPDFSQDELGKLGRSMVIMANSLKDRYSTLESQVQERTKEIFVSSQNIKNQQKAILNILEDVENSNNDLEKFKMAVDNASDHIVITDPDGSILYANKAVEKITGFSLDEANGQKVGNKKLWGGQMPLVFYKKLWKTIKTDKKIFTGEIKNKRKNGEDYIARASISPVLDKKGNVIYFVGIERDITHEKEVDRMKTDFISLASHQLRTPLSAMRWFCEMLLAGDAGKLTKSQSEYVTNISQSNDRMINLVNSLLNISRIESGRIIVDPEPTDLGSLVKDVLAEIDNKIKEKQQQVIISIHSSLPKINVDPKLIREVYKNLLTNANKYTPVGGEISVFISKKNREIISQVSDNGLGIPSQSQPHVFERFYRADNIIKLETEGTGLGLYLAKAIVESSHGKIWFKSNEKTGSTFWFTLPLSGVKPKKGEVTINS